MAFSNTVDHPTPTCQISQDYDFRRSDRHRQQSAALWIFIVLKHTQTGNPSSHSVWINPSTSLKRVATPNLLVEKRVRHLASACPVLGTSEVLP
ncbi:hypothetical protein ASPCADRAFT_212324, partial [Aspergillus carbonarius ITEM 5010]